MAAGREASRSASSPLTEAELERNVKILARVLYRDLRSRDFTDRQIIVFVEELIQCVIAETHTPAA